MASNENEQAVPLRLPVKLVICGITGRAIDQGLRDCTHSTAVIGNQSSSPPAEADKESLADSVDDGQGQSRN
jgi:hypothetical protein